MTKNNFLSKPTSLISIDLIILHQNSEARLPYRLKDFLISIDISNDFVKVSDAVIDEMEENHENEILIYEVQNNIF